MTHCTCGKSPTAYITRISRDSDEYSITYTCSCGLSTVATDTVGKAMEQWESLVGGSDASL